MSWNETVVPSVAGTTAFGEGDGRGEGEGSRGATAEAAFDSCYKSNDGAAARVLMATLAVGDEVLTASASGALSTTRILALQHASADHLSKMRTLHTSDGATVSLTPDHGLFVGGTLAAAAEAMVGSTLTRADGKEVQIKHVTEVEAAPVINPVTARGTILASDSGEPVLAASHPMRLAPLIVKSPAFRAVANVAVFMAGDVTDWTTFAAVLSAKLVATLAAAGIAQKGFRCFSK